MYTTYSEIHRPSRLNLFNTLIKFITGCPGSLRFGSVSHSQDLHYETIADGKRNMRGDLARVGKDWKKTVRKASRDGQKD